LDIPPLLARHPVGEVPRLDELLEHRDRLTLQQGRVAEPLHGEATVEAREADQLVPRAYPIRDAGTEPGAVGGGSGQQLGVLLVEDQPERVRPAHPGRDDHPRLGRYLTPDALLPMLLRRERPATMPELELPDNRVGVHRSRLRWPNDPAQQPGPRRTAMSRG